MLVAYLRQHTSAYVNVYRESLVSCKVAVSTSQHTSADVSIGFPARLRSILSTCQSRWGRFVGQRYSAMGQRRTYGRELGSPGGQRVNRRYSAPLQHTSAYVSIRQRTCPRALDSACRRSTWRHSRRTTRWLRLPFSTGRERTGRSLAFHGILQHTSVYVSIRQYTSAYVSGASHFTAHTHDHEGVEGAE